MSQSKQVSKSKKQFFWNAISQKTDLNTWQISALASKIGQIKKIKAFYSNAEQKPAEGWFLSKLVYNFRPAKILCTYQDIHHIWGCQQQKNGAKSSKH